MPRLGLRGDELASGKNVATTVFLFSPPVLPVHDQERLTAACRAGWNQSACLRRQSRKALNAVPAVCQAPPGFASPATLPLIRSHTGFAR